MTTSRPGRKPPARQAAAPGTGRAAAHLPDDTGPATSHADADTGPPDDVEELQQEIEQTRERLGETVEQLVAKTDVKARAQDKAAELTGRVKEQLSGRVASAVAPVWRATPEPVRQAVAKGASTARQRRVPLAVAAGVLMAGYLIIRRGRRR